VPLQVSTGRSVFCAPGAAGFGSLGVMIISDFDVLERRDCVVGQNGRGAV
jgi:hypothetical protein